MTGLESLKSVTQVESLTPVKPLLLGADYDYVL